MRGEKMPAGFAAWRGVNAGEAGGGNGDWSGKIGNWG